MSEHEDSDTTTSSSHTRRKSPPPQTWFPLAHPPPRSTSCLRLSSRLLLQIQQLSAPTTTTTTHTSSSPPPARAIPILELYQPSRLGKSIADGRKIHSRDMYLTQSEPYVHLPTTTSRQQHQHQHQNQLSSPPSQRSLASSNGKKSKSRRRSKLPQTPIFSSHDEPDEPDDDHTLPPNDVVAVIYTSPKRKADTNPPAELYFPGNGTVWEATISPRGGYRFQQRREKKDGKSQDGSASSSFANSPAVTTPIVVLEWERRAPRSPATSRSRGASGSGTGSGNGRNGGGGGDPLLVSSFGEDENEDRFVLGIADPPALKRPWLAQLTRRGVQVGGWDRWQREQLRMAISEGAGAYTWILTMGVWIARQEGWIQ